MTGDFGYDEIMICMRLSERHAGSFAMAIAEPFRKNQMRFAWPSHESVVCELC